jgi:soluble lytic murein transglycosylase
VIVVLGIIAAITVPAVKQIERALSLPLRYTALIRQQARAKHLDPALIAAVIYAETKFVARTSPTGALGLMQIEPATAQFLAKRSGGTDFRIADLATPSVNIAYGAYYLRYLLDRYGHDETLALAAYNGGETNVDRWVSEAHAANAPFTVASIPFPETRAYVERVERAQREYRRKYGL